MALQFPSNPTDGQQVTLNGKVWRYNATTGLWTVPTVSSTQSVALARTEITATAGQTVLTVTYNTSYGVDISVNGIQLLSTDYTATNGTSITMTEALAAGDQVVVMAATGAPGGVDLTAVEGDIIPATNETQDLGSATNRWKDLYLSGNSIDLGGATITASAGAITLPAGSSVGSTPLGGVQVYADTDALVASSPANGALGFVSANNRLYMYTGAGWFNIALINTSPTITQGGASNYELASDGTPTVITLVAEDPEGLPITWSYNAVSLENHATIVQTDNVFTITPSTNADDAGEFTVTFTASDGVNIATDVNFFTLSFRSSLWLYADLSVDSNSTGGLNNSTFIDRSGNNRGVTILSGTPYQSAFHPYLDNWGVKFDGNDYLQTSNVTNSSLAGATLTRGQDKTIELFVLMPTIPTDVYGVIGASNGGGNQPKWGIFINASTGYLYQANRIMFGAGTGGAAQNYEYVWEPGRWYHIAWVWDQLTSTASMYVNGTRVGTGNVDIDASITTAVDIGSDGEQYKYFNGFISNVRIVNGTALYSGASITPPSQKLDAVTNTTLLACQSNRFIDVSTNNDPITIVGNPKVVAFNPFGQDSEYALGLNRGSVYFDGASDYLDVDASTDIGTGDFTIQGWIYDERAVTNERQIISNRGDGGGLYLGMTSTSELYPYIGGSYATSGAGIQANAWQHFALCRTSGTIETYVNGVRYRSDNQGGDIFGSTGWTIGGGDVGQFKGWIADLRVATVADYTGASYTIPTSPTGSTNADLYLTGDNAGVFDKTGNNYVSDTTETAYTKYNATSTRGLTTSMSAGISSNSTWTVEFWWQDPNNNSFGLLNIQNASNQDVLVLDLSVSYGTMFGYRWGLGQPYTGQGTVGPQPPGGYLFADGWFHVAIVGTGGSAYLYHNGTQIGSRSLSGADMSSAGGRIVINSNRYVEGLQLFNGLAKYTANFTVPNKEQGLNYQAES